LPDDILGDGVVAGAVDVPLEHVRYVTFGVRLEPRPKNSAC